MIIISSYFKKYLYKSFQLLMQKNIPVLHLSEAQRRKLYLRGTTLFHVLNTHSHRMHSHPFLLTVDFRPDLLDVFSRKLRGEFINLHLMSRTFRHLSWYSSLITIPLHSLCNIFRMNIY